MSSLKHKVHDAFEDFCDYMQRDTKGVEIAIYAASGILFSVAYWKIRPITKFGKASDVPTHFVRDKIRQYGTIKGVEMNSKSGGPLLLVDHKAPLNFLIPSSKLFPVKLPGIAVNANGYSWLQTVAVGRKVEFIPINCETKDGSAECVVEIICPENKKTHINASKALLSLGFAKIENIPFEVSDWELKRYYKSLKNTEKIAKYERRGLWSTSLPPQPWPVRKTLGATKSLFLSLLPADRRLPELVR